MFLTNLLPEKLRPFAKSTFAFLIGVVGLLVSLLAIDDETGKEITQALTLLATLLGVYEAANVHPPPEALPVETRTRTDASGQSATRPSQR